MKDSKFSLIAAAFLSGLACLTTYPTARLDAQPAQAQEPRAASVCQKPYAKIESSHWVGRTMFHTLSAGLEGGAGKQGLTYTWTISPGRITSGQGTTAVMVEMPECVCDFHLKLEVAGLEPGCESSIEWAIYDLCFYPMSTDSYGDIDMKNEQERLSKFVPVLQRGQCWTLTITAFGKKGERAGKTLARAQRAKKFIVNKYHVDAGRIEVKDGGLADARKIEVLLYHRSR